METGEDLAWVFRDPVAGHLAAALHLLEREGQVQLAESTHRAAEIAYFTNIASWVKREYWLKAVLEALDKAGMAVMPFKGAVLQSQLYKNSGLRPMGDIDLLVRPEDYLPAARLLLQQGFRLSLSSGFQSLEQLERLPVGLQPGELSFQDKQGLAIDLHQNPVTFPWFLPAYRLDLQGIWERSISLSEQQQNQKELGNGLWKRMLSAEDTLGFLCLHLALHGLQAGKSLLDIDLWVRSQAENWEWQRFVEIAGQWQIRSAAYHALCICKDFYDTPLPQGLLEALDPGRLARGRVKCLISSQAMLANRPTLGRRYPTLVKLALVDRLATIGSMLVRLAFPDREWRRRNPSWKGVWAHWGHILQVIKRGD